MIIIFNGPPGSGKDEAALYLKKFGFEHLSFKKSLYKETTKFFEVDYDWFMSGYIDREIKERKEFQLKGLSRREAMIFTSESIIKPSRGKDYFGVQVANEMIPGRDYVLSDGGFVEELMPIVKRVGVNNVLIVQIFREGCSFKNDSRRYFAGEITKEFINGGKSKIHWRYFLEMPLEIVTYRIHNNGTLEDFYNSLYEMIKGIEKE